MKANKISGRCHSQHLLSHIPISIKYSNFHHIFLKCKINKRNVVLYIAIFAFSLNICRHIKLCTYTYVSLIKISHPKIIAWTKVLMGCFIYILDSSNSSSITLWTSQFGSSSKSNWSGIWTGNSNASWTDKQ